MGASAPAAALYGVGQPDSAPTGSASAGLPPLPDFSKNGQNADPGNQDALAALMSGIAPVKNAVDQITQAAKAIVKLGTIPGAEQIAAQIVSLATSLLPMAAQNLLNPMGGAVGPDLGQMPPPPGGPAPMQGQPAPGPGQQ